MFGPYPLQPIRKAADNDLDRYVRNEFREESSSWYATSIGNGTCLKLPGERFDPKAKVEEAVIPSRQIKCGTASECRCPVLRAASSAYRGSEVTSGGGGSAEP